MLTFDQLRLLPDNIIQAYGRLKAERIIESAPPLRQLRYRALQARTATVSHDRLYIIDGKRTHPMTLRDMGITDPMRWAKDNNIETVRPFEKHRYFYFVGSKSQKKYMAGKLSYEVVGSYPKTDQKRYDDGESIKISVGGSIQPCLF